MFHGLGFALDMARVRQSARTLGGSALALLVYNKFHGLSLGHWSTVAWVVLVLAALVLLLNEDFLRKRRPTLRIGLRGKTLTITAEPPERGSKQRLQANTKALVADIHGYVKDHPPPSAEFAARAQREIAAMQVTDLAGRAEATKRSRELAGEREIAEERASQDLTALYGGRVHHVVGEYLRRGMLVEHEADKMKWEAGSLHWIGSVASQLEGLALRL